MTPKSLFEKGNFLREQAGKEIDPELKKLDLKYISKYYEADIKQNIQRNLALVFILIYVISLGSIIYIAISISLTAAIALFAIEIILATFICGMYLKGCGKITEKGLIAILFQGFKYLFTWREPRKE